MTTVNITYFGMDGSGRTVTEAKRNAGAKIEAALSGTYTPEILTLGCHAYLLWREPHGWMSRAITGTEGIRGGQVYGGSGREDRSEARAEAMLQLAMNAWHGPQDTETCLAYLTSLRREQAELRSWVGFQLAYRHAAKDGKADHECHSWACDHGREFAPAA